MLDHTHQISIPSQENPNRNYISTQIISQDGETVVYEGKLIENEKEINVVIRCQCNNKDSELEFIDWLISQQKQNQAREIIKIYEKIENNHKTYLITEFSSLKLSNYLKENKQLSRLQKIGICNQTLDVILFLHHNQYFNGNILSENFVQVGNIFKLANFGFRKFYQKTDENQKIIDIQSLGCLFYEIFKGEKLFQGQIELESQKYNDFNFKGIEFIPKVNDISWQQMSNLILEMIQKKIQDIQKIQDGLNNLREKQLQPPLPQFYNYQQQVNSIFDAPTGQFPKRYFVLSKLIGDGGEGAVYQAKAVNETFYSTEVALKIQQKMKDQELQFIDYLIDYQKNKEQTAFQKSNLIRVYERFEYQKQQVLIMELGIKDMNSVLKTNRIPQQQKEQICQQIAQSIAFLHKLGLIHRDIKPENFIQVGSIYKLIDFGLVKHGEQNLRKTKMVGSPQYQAPEIINGSDDYTASVDIWSLGCLFFEIFKQSPLFNGSSIREIQQSIFNYCQNQQQVRFEIQQLQIREELKNLLSQMIDPIPHKRPNIDSVQKQLQLKFPQSINLVQSAGNNQAGEQRTKPIFQTTTEVRINDNKNNEKQQKYNENISKLDQIVKDIYEQYFDNSNWDCQKKIAETQQNFRDHLNNQIIQLGQKSLPNSLGQSVGQVQNQIFNNQFHPSTYSPQQQTNIINNFHPAQ
ncbi:unnamed protein product (macronuclear) [Paramecium tetraurelia]|uniref:Protein kinase domain-containing protein n=1 Tax=Paramecium tetraurelia TaxID=5888 RepID=A0DKK7_PARTE|nr:uncharacterized protein GSPATT00017904001 [Paramecium tetraurelia]CAK83574.1 unnamed protein product [Paramecium tetraurelia]|eukprot:XP_001450971.1 hypothetical protein (macronuclear) [Paramecium tetraurelia strain d4-2]